MTRRRKKSYWRPTRAPKQLTLDEGWRIAEAVAKGEEADRAMVARLHEESEEAVKKRNRGLVLRAWELAAKEIFPKFTQSNLAKRYMLQDLLVWLANAGRDGLQISHKSLCELKGYKRSTLTDAIRTLTKAKLIVVEAKHRCESPDGSQRDRGPNLYRVDWVGVASRLAAASEGEAAPAAESSSDQRPAPAGADDRDSHAPAVEVRLDPDLPDSPESGGCAEFQPTYAESRHTSAEQARQTCAGQARQRHAEQARHHIGKQVRKSSPLPPVAPAAVAAPADRGKRALPAGAAEGIASWKDAERRLRDTGLSLGGVLDTLRSCRRRGYSPQGVIAVCEVFFEFRGEFTSPGAVMTRLRLPPEIDPLDEWPTKQPLRREPPGSPPRSRFRSDVNEFDRRVIALVHAWCEADPDLDRCDATDRAEALVREKYPELAPSKEATS